MAELWRIPWDNYAITGVQQAEMLAAVRVDQLPAIEQVRMSDIRVARHGELFLTAMWNVCRCYAGDDLMDSSAWLMERQYEAISREFDITSDVRAEVGCTRTVESAIAQIILEARARDDLRWIDSLDELRGDVALLDKPDVSLWLEILFVGVSMGAKEVWRLNGDSYAIVPTEKVGLIPGLVRVDNLPSLERMAFSQCRVDFLVKAITSLNQHLLGHESTSPIGKQLREQRAGHRRYLIHEIDESIDLWLSAGAGASNVEDLIDRLILEGQTQCQESLEPLISLQELDRSHGLDKELVGLKRRSSSKSIKKPSESCDRTIQESPSIPILETTFPVQENLISSQQDSLVTTPVALATVEGLMENTPSSGGKCSDVSASLNLGLSLWSNLEGLSIEDFEQSLPHSEWLDIQDAISNSYQQRSLGQCTDATGSLSCPTPTASAGENSRPAGQTKCEEWWMNSGIIPSGLQLSAIAMALLQGFPADYLNVVSPPLETIPEDSPLESLQGALSLPPKQLSLLPELNTSMAVSNLTNVEEVTEQIPTSKIARDGGTQSRASVNVEISKEYAEYYHSGIELPPIVVFFDGERYWLADGFHRLEAQLMVGRATVEAIVRQGVRRDAVLCSVGANITHGLRRTNADKRRAVEMLLQDEEWRGWSDNKIAAVSGVTQPFVWRVRKDLFPERDSTRTYTNKQGKTAQMNIGKIGRAKPLPLSGDIELPSLPLPLEPVVPTIPVLFAVGDVVEFINPSLESGWKHGDRAKVKAVDLSSEAVIIDLDGVAVGDKLAYHGFDSVRLAVPVDDSDYDSVKGVGDVDDSGVEEEGVSDRLDDLDSMLAKDNATLAVYQLAERLQGLSSYDLGLVVHYSDDDFLKTCWEMITSELDRRRGASA